MTSSSTNAFIHIMWASHCTGRKETKVTFSFVLVQLLSKRRGHSPSTSSIICLSINLSIPYSDPPTTVCNFAFDVRSYRTIQLQDGRICKIGRSLKKSGTSPSMSILKFTVTAWSLRNRIIYPPLLNISNSNTHHNLCYLCM